jgi:hypothetical protein
MGTIEYKKFKGLDNVTDRVRLSAYKDAFMTIAENIDIDDDYKVWRRKSYTKKLSGSTIRNVWSNNFTCLYMSGSTLKRMWEDYSTTTIYSGLSSEANVRYVDTPQGIFFSDGTKIGTVETGVGSLLPTVTDSFKRAMPAGNMLEYDFSRLFSIVNNVVYFSDVGKPKQYDIRKNFIQFPGKVTMFKAVKTGFFASTGELVYYLHGTNPEELAWKRTECSPAIEGTAVQVDGWELTPGNFERVVVWAAPAGAYLGGEGGFVKALTAEHFNYDSGIGSGTSLYRDDLGYDQYLVSYSKE